MPLSSDVRLAFRSLLRYRLVSLAALVSLVLGLTANSTVFSVLYGVLLRPLPFEEPERIVRVHGVDPESGSRGLGLFPPLFLSLKHADLEGVESVAAIVADQDMTFQVETEARHPFRVRGAVVSEQFFPIFGVPAARGRTFGPDEAGGSETADPVVLSHRVWRSRFGAVPDVVGRALMLNDRPFTVIGVMPSEFGFPNEVDLWVLDPSRASRLRNLAVMVQANFDVVGRLAPGVSLETAEDEIQTVYRAAHGGFRGGPFNPPEIQLVPLHDSLTEGAERSLVLLQVGVGAVLLICCINVGGLLLIKTSRQSSEFAVRAVLGARSHHLLRQVLVEMVVLFSVAGLLSVLVSRTLLALLLANAPVGWIQHARIGTDGTTIAFVLLTSVGGAACVGLFPLIATSRLDLSQAIKPGRQERSRSGLSLGHVVVIGEIALAISLLIGASLVTRTLTTLQGRDLGVTSRNVLLARVTLLKSRYPERADLFRYTSGLRRELDALPQVEAAGATQYFFLTGRGYQSLVAGWDGAPEDLEIRRLTGVAYVTPGYLEALSISPVVGRGFEDHAGETSLAHAVITRSFAEELWPETSPLGRTVELEGRSWTVIGVVGDVAAPGVDDVDDVGAPEIFVPQALARLVTGEVTFLVRGRSSDASMIEAVRATIRSYDAEQAIDRLILLDDLVGEELAPQQFVSTLLLLFSGIATVLAGVGTYGAIGFSVTRRTAEFGVRMAIGASRQRILRDLLWWFGRYGVTGIVAGAFLAALFARSLQALLFGISIWDTRAWITGLVVGILVPALAALVPAIRATSLDPAVALRDS